MAKKKVNCPEEDNDFQIISEEESFKKETKSEPEITEEKKEKQSAFEESKKQEQKKVLKEEEIKPEVKQEVKQTSRQQEKNAEAEEFKRLLQLTQADFDNYRKRSFALMQNARFDGELNVLTAILPALDSFNKAKEMISDANVLKGIEMIYKQLFDSLANLGVKEINPVGEEFDPNFHNAISVSNNKDLKDNVVVQVYQKGYIYNDKVIRYAQVIINKN